MTNMFQGLQDKTGNSVLAVDTPFSSYRLNKLVSHANDVRVLSSALKYSFFCVRDILIAFLISITAIIKFPTAPLPTTFTIKFLSVTFSQAKARASGCSELAAIDTKPKSLSGIV